MFDFYGDVLGLEQLPTIGGGNGGGVARFQAGASQLKFTSRVADRRYAPGGVVDATGLRLITLFFPDREALVARFRQHGYPAPEFRAVEGTDREVALVEDPDAQWVELVVAPGEPAATYDQIEVGLTVSDLDASRAFYRDFVGLTELPAVEDPVFATTKYPFRHGATTVSLRSFGRKLPADTGSGGIQYVVSDVDAVDRLAREREVAIDRSLDTSSQFSLRTIWLEDPDGITNYFAETRASRAAREIE